jgi:DNA-binding winged helix-turn-helix (wHTH) protein
MRYIFGDCELEPQRYELRRHGQRQPIEPQVFDVLVLLIQERHRVVTKQELLDTVWGHRFVGDSALTSRIKSLRQAVGDDGTTQGIVRTVRSRGYQFVTDVIERADPSTPSRPRPRRCRHTASAHAAPSTGCGRTRRLRALAVSR